MEYSTTIDCEFLADIIADIDYDIDIYYVVEYHARRHMGLPVVPAYAIDDISIPDEEMRDIINTVLDRVREKLIEQWPNIEDTLLMRAWAKQDSIERDIKRSRYDD